jgi:hypothetical protein
MRLFVARPTRFDIHASSVHLPANRKTRSPQMVFRYDDDNPATAILYRKLAKRLRLPCRVVVDAQRQRDSSASAGTGDAACGQRLVRGFRHSVRQHDPKGIVFFV